MVVDCQVVHEHQGGTHALSRAAPLVNLLDKVAHQLLGVIPEHKHRIMLGFRQSLSDLLVHLLGLAIDVGQHNDRDSGLVLELLLLAQVLEHRVASVQQQILVLDPLQILE